MRVARIGATTIGVLTLAWSLLACSSNNIVGEALYIPGDASTEEKLSVAKAIGDRVWHAGLPAKVGAQFPELSQEQLQGLFLKWDAITVTPLTGDGEPGTGVRLMTGIRHSGDVDNASAIAKFCADIVAEAIGRELGVSEVHRLDFNERTVGF